MTSTLHSFKYFCAMAHRIYLYNYNPDTNEVFETHLGEWNYEIPLLLYPLLTADVDVQGVEFIANKAEGIVQFRAFFNLLADTYQLHYKKDYYEAVNKMFAFLEALPYSAFLVNATDVFNMNEEKHKVQAKQWVQDLKLKGKLYKKAIKKQDVSVLESLFTHTGYADFLEILKTDWINYGLGYFEEHAYKKVASSRFEAAGKYGLQDAKGALLAPAIYDEIFEPDYLYDNAVVEKAGLFGYLKSDGTELVPPIYTEVSEVFDFSDEPLGEVKVADCYGVLKVHTNTWLIAPEFDAVKRVAYGFFELAKENKYGVFSDQSGLIIPIESESAFDYDYYPELFFTKKEGTRKRSYYTREGKYLGDFLENGIVKASTCFWIKPNKSNIKGRLLQQQGETILDDVEQLCAIDNFDVLALRQGKTWSIYNAKTHQFLLETEVITKVKGENNAGYPNNVFTLETAQGLGFFDADAATWLLGPSLNIKRIDYLENGYLSVKSNAGYQLFNFESGLSAATYTYISNPLNYRTEEGLLFLYQQDALFKMTEAKEICQVATAELGEIYVDRYSFRGKDLEYFTAFYKRWSQGIRGDAEQFMDVETIKKMAFQALENQDYSEAIRLFELAVHQKDLDSLVELGLLYTDPEIESLFAPQKGIAYYEKAAKEKHPIAWNNLGALYQNGIGFAFDIKKAIKAFTKAAALGDAMALVNLGDLYYFGTHVKEDSKKALNYYLKAEKSYLYNYDKIAELYYQLRNYEELLVYLKKDYDKSYSSIYYGILYEHGMGVKADVKKAIKYFEQANAYSAYEYATQRLVYYYGTDLSFKNDKKYQKWVSFAAVNGFEIETR